MWSSQGRSDRNDHHRSGFVLLIGQGSLIRAVGSQFRHISNFSSETASTNTECSWRCWHWMEIRATCWVTADIPDRPAKGSRGKMNGPARSRQSVMHPLLLCASRVNQPNLGRAYPLFRQMLGCTQRRVANCVAMPGKKQ